jgi:sugar lactone lactonase YvrE
MSNRKKAFLIVFGLVIVGLNAALYSWEASIDRIQQSATRLDYIADRSPDFIAFDKQGRVWTLEHDRQLSAIALIVYQDGEPVEKFTHEDIGLLHSSPKAYAFDDRGWAWFWWPSVIGGLAVFDGSSWEIYESDADLLGDLTSPWYAAAAVDPQGRVWISIYDYGIRVFDGETWQDLTMEDSGLPDNRVNDIAFDDRGLAWIATQRGGIATFDGENWQSFNTSNSSLPSNRCDQIVFGEQGYVWIRTEGRISVYNGETWRHYPAPSNLSSTMFCDGLGRLWAVRDASAYVLDGDEWEYFFDPGTDFRPRLVDPQGNIWMSNGRDAMISVAPEDITFQSISQSRARAFVHSGGLIVVTLVLGMLWLAIALNAWWAIGISILVGYPIYLVWIMFNAQAPAKLASFSGAYTSNPGALIAVTVLIGGMLGALVKRRSESGRAEKWGIVIGLAAGIGMTMVFCCVYAMILILLSNM